MSLFGKLVAAKDPEALKRINDTAAKSLQLNASTKSTKTKSINNDLNAMSEKVVEYFADSQAMLISSVDELHEYVTKVIEAGYAGIDTETTGLDRVKDTIVGASLYYPGGVECYIPMKHLVPIFDEPYKNQLTYSEVGQEFQRLVDGDVKLIFANADFDLSMIYKDLKVDLNDVCYYDVILAWRCLKENERDNALKVLYNKYVMRGKGDPMKFRDFFTPQLFPYCKPEVAKLYAANDAKITFDLFKWQLPYVTEDNTKCKKNHLEQIAHLVWDVEIPLIKVCQNMHRTGIYLDKNTASVLVNRYRDEEKHEMEVLAGMVDELLENSTSISSLQKPPFTRGSDFNPKSPPHVKYLLYSVMNLPKGKNGESTDKQVLGDLNLPVTKQILKVRSLGVLISTFVEKLPRATTPDSRIHAQFRQIGADCVTGDTIIPTSRGYYTAKDLCECAEDVPGQHVDIDGVEIVNKDQVNEAASSAIYYHNYDTVRITTEMGFVLEGTPNHPIMVSSVTSKDKHIIYNDAKLATLWDDRHFKSLSEINVGDIVEIPCNYPTGGFYQPTGLVLGPVYNNRNADATIPDIYDEPFAEFLGMYHADGSAYSREGTYTVALSNDDPDVYSRFSQLALNLFNVSTCQYKKQADINEVETYINCKRIESVDKILSHGKQNKRIPDAIWKSPASVINAYIRGLTLDSSVHFEKSTGRAEFELSVINELDARLIQLHLASQGILCGWGYSENKGFNSPRLKFNADNYLKFVDEIGFIESRKVVHTEGCVKNPYQRRRIGDSFRVHVKSIEHRNADVYDLHVPVTHSFISNGVISHNTGRMSSAEPNMQNIPSHAVDIRHMFRATPGYVMLSSDYSQQEPKITAFVSQDPNMIDAFQHGKDIYATIASLAFKLPYEKCLEFHPETHEYQPDGKARRGEAKTIVLGITYGRSVVTIADQLFGTNDNMTQDEKIKAAQDIYDAVLNAFPNLRKLMTTAQGNARKLGYVETILGRRRHLPDMQLPEFEFSPMKGYVNPDVDPMDPSTLTNKDSIPERVVRQLQQEFKSYNYFGQIAKRTRELYEDEHIRVTNNRLKIADASRQCVNSIIQGSAADMTKMAILQLENSDEWRALGGRLLVPVHDELICEVPLDKWKEGGELLSKTMSDAGSFLPFPINCDVTTTLRWYGLEYPCAYEKPASMADLNEEGIKWLQYQLCELEYILPTFKDENGEKPRGDAAHGVNGKDTSEFRDALKDYMRRRNITENDLLDTLEHEVVYGS